MDGRLLVVVALLGLLAGAEPAAGLGCPAGCECNDDTFVVRCERSKLDVLPITLNPAIQRLVLRNNKIKTVDAAFQFYRDLQYVDLSSNHLLSIPTRSFVQQEKLQELHLNKNKLSAVGNRTFQGLKALTVLNLRENFIEELPAGVFAVLGRLEELNLGQNRIARVDALAFDGLRALRVLYLDDNQLSGVPTPAFAVTGSLAELHVGLNDFSALPADAFAGLARLAVLDVSGAGLANISALAFRALAGLRTLNLADNRLAGVPTAPLAALARLEELAVGQNEFVALDAHAFRGLGQLRRLDVTGAPQLRVVRAAAFADNLNLETVVLASNRRLAAVEAGALAGLPNLRHLVLRENALRSLPEAAAAWAELRTLELAGNPLHCDCALLWLADLLGARNLSGGGGGGVVHCASPAALRDRALRSLGADALGCSSLRDPRQQAILVTLGVSAALLVAVMGLLLLRYRQRVREALQQHRWNKRAISRKEHEYQKTFSDDELIMRQAAAAAAVAQQQQQQHQHQLHHHHHHQQQQHAHLKPIPVTEL